MKTENPVRVATLGKIQRDGERMKQFARFVIVLERGSPKIIDNRHLLDEGKPFAHLIAVLGPARHNGALVPEAVLLEVGYSRTRPYMQLEQRKHEEGGRRLKDGRWFLKERVRARKISNRELGSVYPYIEQCMAQIVLECRETWRPESREPRWVDGPGWVDRGIYFTVSKSDRLLHRQILAEDVRYRKEKYILKHARHIDRWIGRYRLGHSDKRLRGFIKISQAAELIASKNYRNPLYRRALFQSFPVNSHARLLLERMDSLFSLQLEEESDDTRLLEELRTVALKPFQKIRCRIVDQPKVHANGSIVTEITLERKFRELNECPF